MTINSNFSQEVTLLALIETYAQNPGWEQLALGDLSI
jgi:hypothetical protein